MSALFQEDVFNIIACGVGGQGIVLMTNIIGEACSLADKRVVSGEMHGLSQRGGTVIIHQRIGENALSPLIPYGEADVILSLEYMEALRYLYYLKPKGTVITNSRIIHPPGESQDVVLKKVKYVTPAEITDAIASTGTHLIRVDALELARKAGNPMAENVVMVGALSALPDFPVEKSLMLEAVRVTVPPKTVKENLRAFEYGFRQCSEQLQ